MPRIIEDVVKLNSLPSSLCKELGGIETNDGKCIIKVEIDENNPKTAKLLGIRRSREGLR